MKMRHALTACAVAALAMGAQAANVQLYGLIDTGLSFKSVDADNGKGRVDNLSVGTSQLAPNRWGMRGTEDLGNGLKVGFNLEGQFAGDTGEMIGGRLFHRMAQLSLMSADYGTLVMGRSGALRSGFGTTGLWGAKTGPFSNSAGSFIAGHKYIMPGGFKAMDNTVTYQSPKFAGAQLHLQYSSDNGADKDGVENKDSATRQWGVGMTYGNGPLNVVAIFDATLYQTAVKNPERGLAFSLEADYKFDFAKIYAAGMWFDDMRNSKAEFQGHDFNGKNHLTAKAYKGYSLELGADIPAMGGNIKANIGWMDAESSFGDEQDTDRLSLGLGYVYNLSKRSQLYTAAGYIRDSYKSATSKEVNPDAYELIVGLKHTF